MNTVLLNVPYCKLLGRTATLLDFSPNKEPGMDIINNKVKYLYKEEEAILLYYIILYYMRERERERNLSLNQQDRVVEMKDEDPRNTLGLSWVHLPCFKPEKLCFTFSNNQIIK